MKHKWKPYTIEKTKDRQKGLFKCEVCGCSMAFVCDIDINPLPFKNMMDGCKKTTDENP